jgi:ADP-ribose pyrophosphatase
MKSPKRGGKTLIHENPFSKIYKVEADFGSFTKNYYINEFGPRAGVVAVRDGCILLTRQYRLLPDRVTFEIPGGKIEDGEAPEEAARRECLEETGIVCGTLDPLILYQPGLDNFENATSVFVCENLTDTGDFQPDPREVLDVVWMPVDECLDMIYQGKLIDALTIVGALAYAGRDRHRLQG